MDKSWEFRHFDSQVYHKLSHEMGLSSLVARILSARNQIDPDHLSDFLDPRLGSIRDPFSLKDMDRAARRLAQAVDRKEKIFIYGDYDVDGVTATVLLLRLLDWLGIKAEHYIPNRLTEGYGMNKKAIKRIASAGADLLITVDNGISSLQEVEYARSLGLDVIITDHHQSGDEIPEACAVVNPNRSDDPYDTPLAGVGVAFKLAHALLKEINAQPDEAKEFLTSHLDLVALGTVADIVPLTGENRVLVTQGMKILRDTDKVGLSTLLELVCGLDREINSDAISYYLAPRLNAAGRHAKADLCVSLLRTEDRLKAIELSRQLNRLNDERRKLENDILSACLNLIEQNTDEGTHVIVANGEGWHLGVVGIVASRILERFYRPVIVLAMDKDTARGSGRSIKGFDLYQALTRCGDFLSVFGGHKRAVGLTMSVDNISPFRRAINEYAAETLDSSIFQPSLTIDSEVSPEELTMENVEDLQNLEPFGSGNPSPVFALNGATLLYDPRVVGKDHLKLVFNAGGYQLSAIGFSMASRIPELENPEARIDVAFKPFINRWRGRSSVELEIKDMKIST